MVEAEGKAAFHAQDSERILDKKRLKSGKLGERATQPQHLPDQPSQCPECESRQLYKDGLRYTTQGSIQRFLCRSCGYRFSQSSMKLDVHGQISEVLDSGKNNHKQRIVTLSSTVKEAPDDLPLSLGKDVRAHDLTIIEKGLNALPYSNSNRQVCELDRGSKNLSSATESKTVAGESQKADTEAQIVKYLIHLKNSGRREATIEARDQQLKRLVQLGADLNDGESVKSAIASLDRTESYKALLCIAYEGFARKNGIPWTRPSYKQSSPLPFVPHESEIDALISGSPKKTATLLRLLKETAMRLGEAWLVEWTDVDSQNHTVTCRNPEKNSRSRAFEISGELCQMLQSLPHNSQYIFTCNREPLAKKEDRRTHLHHLKRQKGLLSHQRRRIAEKLKNPRITEITYHSLRHWKATQLYHQTKDILYVMKFLGHRDVKNTLIYIDLESVCYSKGGEDYHAKTAKTETEAIQLVEAGFEYVCDIGEVKLFRKRK